MPKKESYHSYPFGILLYALTGQQFYELLICFANFPDIRKVECSCKQTFNFSIISKLSPLYHTLF